MKLVLCSYTQMFNFTLHSTCYKTYDINVKWSIPTIIHSLYYFQLQNGRLLVCMLKQGLTRLHWHGLNPFFCLITTKFLYPVRTSSVVKYPNNTQLLLMIHLLHRVCWLSLTVILFVNWSLRQYTTQPALTKELFILL